MAGSKGGNEVEPTMKSSLDTSVGCHGESTHILEGQARHNDTPIGSAGCVEEEHDQTYLHKGHTILESHSPHTRTLEGQAPGEFDKHAVSDTQRDSPEPATVATTFDLFGDMANAARSEDVASVGQTVVSVASQAASIQKFDRQEDVQHIHHIDMKVLGKRLDQIKRDLEEAVHNLLACIGDLGNQTCPLELMPSDHLSALYARCLGPDWADVAGEYNSYNAFKAPEATMSLISAFLYDSILMQQAYDPDFIKDIVELARMRGYTGKAALKVYDFANKEENLFESACTIAAEEVRAAIAQDDDAFQLQLLEEAENHMRVLWRTLASHFRNQAHTARSLHLSSGRSEEEIDAAMFNVFEHEITAIINKTLLHKKQLVATGCEHAYIWPSNGDKIDQHEMREHGASTHDPLVRYTVFPGLRVKLPSSYRGPGDPIRSFVLTKFAAS